MTNLNARILAGLLLLALSAQTQTVSPRGKHQPATYFNIMVNMAASTFNYGSRNAELSEYKKLGKGMRIGLSFQGGVSSHFSMITELYYIKKGGILADGNPLTNTEYDIQLHTIELPVLARFHFGKVYVNAGPSVGYLLRGKLKQQDHTVDLPFTACDQGIRKMETGMQIGGGVEFLLKKKRLALDLRYNHGLTSVSYGTERYNRSLMISVLFSKAWKSNPLAMK